jgi:hypothetical protein
VAGRDITEGRGDRLGPTPDNPSLARAIATDIGIVSDGAVWQNTDINYDVAIGGLPFIYAISDARPYIRQTAPFRKDQFDNQTEPGEQSLTGWWIRSQSSFHGGTGIVYFDPQTSDPFGHYRFADSKGVDVFKQGEVTLLNNVDVNHITTGRVRDNGRPFQSARSIKYGSTEAVLLWDEYDVDKIVPGSAPVHFIDYNAGTDAAVYAICDDGTNAFWITNTATKKTVYKKPLTGTSASTADVTKMFDEIGTVANATMEYVKERIVLCADNKVYEFSSSATAMPTAVYTHPSTTHVYTSVAASGSSIYVSGYNGIQSTILKFTLSTSGVMPTLAAAVVAAELPVGEIVHKIYYYLGFMMIGTNKGIRAAAVSEVDGSLNYGPLIVETTQPCYDFAARDRFVWCATSVKGEPGVIRMDLGTEIETLRFAYANDIYYPGVTGHVTTTCAFVNGTEQLAFATSATSAGTIVNKALTSNVATLTTSAAHNLAVSDSIWVEGVDATFNGEHTVLTVPTTTTFTFTKTATNVTSTAVTSAAAIVANTGGVYVEDLTELTPTGYLTTGNIRYNTLEKKNFKRLLGRGDFTYGSMTLDTVDEAGVEYDVISYDASVGAPEVTTSSPAVAQEYLAYKFIMYRDGTTPSRGPQFKGYQAKATIATPRQRVMQFPVYCYDIETDRYNVVLGYEGRAFDKIRLMEDIEANGDVVTWQDLTTGESRQAVIEQVTFTRLTPPDKRFDGFGGVLQITIRTV